MIDTGTGLALLGGGIPLAAAILKFVPQRACGNGYVSKEVCETVRKNMKEGLDRVEGAIVVLGEKIDRLRINSQKGV